MYHATIWGKLSWNGTDYTTTQAGTRIAKDVLQTKYWTWLLPLNQWRQQNNLFWESLSLEWYRHSNQAGTKKRCTADQVLELDCNSKTRCRYYTNLFWRVFLLNTDYTTTQQSFKRMYLIKYWTWLLQLNQLKYLLQLQSVLVKLILGILMNFLQLAGTYW
jgi:hypothetical protein